MSSRLIYVVGPSGAGKDSLLAWLQARQPPLAGVHWARRTIVRPTQPGGEAHESVTAAQFEQLLADGAFAMAWRANGTGYGIRKTELAPLAHGAWGLVNGSRAHLPVAQALYPGLHVLHITASADTLRRRIAARGRENAAQTEQRLARASAFSRPVNSVEVHNDGTLEDAGQQLLTRLRSLPGWPG